MSYESWCAAWQRMLHECRWDVLEYEYADAEYRRLRLLVWGV